MNTRKWIATTLFMGTLPLSSAVYADYQGSKFQDVWAAAQENPYSVLPEDQVTVKSFYNYLTDNLQKASERTLTNNEDVLPYFQKLVHPNAICYSGTWNITEETPYSGYFKKDSKGLIIFRASAALTPIHRGEKRSFGLAGKIFPTTDTGTDQPLKTANFFVIDNLAGTYTPNYLDTAMTNDITAIAFGPDNLKQTGILAAAAKAFSFAEKVIGKIVTIRQLYEISELGEAPGATIVTPKWIKIQGQPGPRTALNDFRDDLRLENNNGSLRFDISISSEGVIGTDKVWTKVGYIEATEQSLAEGCDHRLHFHHPMWRTDLKSE